jgi:glycosyltransferase involved in cell wall biosynthesis
MKIIIVGSSAYFNASGGKVLRYITNNLMSNGHEVEIVIFGNPREDSNDFFHKNFNISYLGNRGAGYNRFNHILKYSKLQRFEEILISAKPDLVHFAPFDYSISRYAIETAIKTKNRVILEPWTYNFFCHQMFAYREGNACSLCVETGYYQSIKMHCATACNIHSIISRKLIQSSALKANGFLSSNSFLDEVLLKYGVEPTKIFRFPIPYEIKDSTTICGENEEDYFIFYGQFKDFKGIEVLTDIFSNLPGINLRIYPIGPYSQFKKISTNIKIYNDVTWGSGLDAAIKNAKAVVLPTLWPTTTEYALYEAMNNYKAIVAFNIGAHKEILINGYNALVARVGNINEFTDAILLLNKDKELRTKLGQNAFVSLKKLTSPDIIYKMLMDIYKKVNEI